MKRRLKNFKNSLVDLRTILEVMGKNREIEISGRLETGKKANMTKKELKKLEIIKIDELEKLERKSNFAAMKKRFWERPNSIKEN